MIEVEVGLLDLAENLGSVWALEWQIAADECVEENAERPDVSFPTVAAFEDFWGHVVRCTSHGRQLTVVSAGLGETEVDETHRVVIGDHDIVGLDIPVNNVLRVAMIDGLKQTLHVPGRRCFWKRLIGLLSDLLEKLSTSDVFHDQVNVFQIVVGLVILYDIRMVKRMQDGDFLHDAINIIS